MNNSSDTFTHMCVWWRWSAYLRMCVVSHWTHYVRLCACVYVCVRAGVCMYECMSMYVWPHLQTVGFFLFVANRKGASSYNTSSDNRASTYTEDKGMDLFCSYVCPVYDFCLQCMIKQNSTKYWTCMKSSLLFRHVLDKKKRALCTCTL